MCGNVPSDGKWLQKMFAFSDESCFVIERSSEIEPRRRALTEAARLQNAVATESIGARCRAAWILVAWIRNVRIAAV